MERNEKTFLDKLCERRQQFLKKQSKKSKKEILNFEQKEIQKRKVCLILNLIIFILLFISFIIIFGKIFDVLTEYAFQQLNKIEEVTKTNQNTSQTFKQIRGSAVLMISQLIFSTFLFAFIFYKLQTAIWVIFTKLQSLYKEKAKIMRNIRKAENIEQTFNILQEKVAKYQEKIQKSNEIYKQLKQEMQQFIYIKDNKSKNKQ